MIQRNNCIRCSIKNEIIHTEKEVPIYIFGASYNTSLLLHKISNLINIKGILDNCAEKQDHYFYGYNYKVLSPTILENENAIVILKMVFIMKKLKNPY